MQFGTIVKGTDDSPLPEDTNDHSGAYPHNSSKGGANEPQMTRHTYKNIQFSVQAVAIKQVYAVPSQLSLIIANYCIISSQIICRDGGPMPWHVLFNVGCVGVGCNHI